MASTAFPACWCGQRAIYHMGPVAAALRINLPSAIPYLFTGVKLAIAYCFIGVIAAEFIMASSGLGYSISYAFNNFDNGTMYALMLFVIVLVTVVERAVLQLRTPADAPVGAVT